MNYEKLYNNALERASKLRVQNPFDTVSQMMEHIFPELKQSEDERIKEAIVATIHLYYGEPLEKEAKEMIAWLEKQNDIDKATYEIAEKEKRDFVGDGFIKCYANFQDFKEGKNYWLEYIGNDNYNVRSDNLFGKTYHITPCQLYTIFKKQTWLEKQGEKPLGKTALEAINEENVDNANMEFKAKDWYVSKVDGKIHKL